MSYAVKKALQIDGWMWQTELEWLARRASAYDSILEVGSWKGRSTKALALSTPGTVLAIDAWDTTLDDQEGTYGEALRRGWKAIFKDFLNNLFDEIFAERLSFIKSPFVGDAIDNQKGFTMIFLDGDHRYGAVKSDILLALELLEYDGGLLCGHDYSPDCPDVMRAVDEMLPDRKIMPEGRIWYVEL